MADQDTIIIGGGHNGLVCAIVLARAGQRVTVLEAGSNLGGMAAEREFHPGFRSTLAQTLYAMPRSLIRELDLTAHGLEFATEPLPIKPLSVNGTPKSVTASSLVGADDDDTAAYPKYVAMLAKFAAALAPFWERTMPRVGATGVSDLMTFGKLGLKLRLLGKEDMLEFFRVATLPMRDLLDEHFSDDRLKAALCWDALVGSQLAPRSPNQAVLTLLNRMAGKDAGQHMVPKGGMPGLVRALENAAVQAGVTIRTDCTVKSVQIGGDENGQRCNGVELESGELLLSDRVVSSADPQTTFLNLVGAQHLEIEFTNRIRRLRNKGYVARLHLALSELPAFQGLDSPEGRLIIAPTMDSMEFAWDAAKYGELPEAPVMEVLIPSLQEPNLAPQGQHVLAANVMYVPHDLKSGWTPERRAELLNTVLSELTRYAPGIQDLVLGSELLTPQDLATQYRATNGHWHHCEPAIDQLLMMRPTYEAAQYATPISGLYLCGAGCHPAGDVSGNPGRNAAREILA